MFGPLQVDVCGARLSKERPADLPWADHLPERISRTVETNVSLLRRSVEDANAHIRGAEPLEMPGVDHDPWVGDTERVLDAVAAFIARPAVSPHPTPGKGPPASIRGRS